MGSWTIKMDLILTLYSAMFLPVIMGHYPCGLDLKCSCGIDGDNLASMNCNGRQFSNLSKICDYIGNVTRLDASKTNINGTLSGNFSGCQHLQVLSLRYNQIHDIDSVSLGKLQKLTFLDISHNMLDIYTSKTKSFEHLLRLKNLKLNGNLHGTPLQGPQRAYPDLSANLKLASLHIDGLQSDYFDETYSGLLHLKTLVMSGQDGVCNLSYIDDHFFTNLIHLEVLNLSNCNIRNIEFNAFTITTKLVSLDLAYNQNLGLRTLYNISHGLQFTNIRMLNYSHAYGVFGLGTEVTKLDLCFLRNTTLREFVLNGNRIQLFETNALMLMPPSLNILHVEDNIFTFGPYLLQMGCTFNVTDLYANFQNVAHNFRRYDPDENISEPEMNYTGYCPFIEDAYLKAISKKVGNCKFIEPKEKLIFVPTIAKAIRSIHFTDSNMKYRVNRVFALPLHNNIEYIDLSGNIFHQLIGPVGPAENLKYLDLSRNYCTYIGEKFFEYSTVLKNLQIHSNFIGFNMSNYAYTGAFHYMKNLQIMNLSINKITTVHPRLLEGLGNLQILDLSFNNIDEWTLNVDSLSNLSTILLRSNSLSSLPSSLINHLNNISNFTIDLRNNVLKYGCKTERFLSWMVEHRKSFVKFDEYVFVDEDGNTLQGNEMVSKIRSLDKQCRSYTVWIVVSSIGVSVALSVIIGSLLYRNRWKIRYFMYMSKQRFYGYVRIPNEPAVENYKYDAFISYAEENLRFVKDEIIPNVEQDGVSLCIHQRNFMPGNAIADNIIDAIKSSRKTVVLLTEAFLRRKWCIYEFNMARMESIYSRDGRSCLLIVMLETVPPKQMPLEMVEWIKDDSYLEYTKEEGGEALFWNNLIETVRA